MARVKIYDTMLTSNRNESKEYIREVYRLRSVR